MKKLFTDIEYLNSNYSNKLPCQCYQCNKTFYITKKRISESLYDTHNTKAKFCSRKCVNLAYNKTLTLTCSNCETIFNKKYNQYKRSKSSNHFCSRSCAATFNNKHKLYGTRRSKLEIWIEEQLTILYPNLDIKYNESNIIGSELDIYIPSLNIAFELNGIFHYEPIYGVDKLEKIQENDKSKTKACHDAKIDLCIIDTSTQKYVKPKTSQKYLDIITNIINQRTILNS